MRNTWYITTACILLTCSLSYCGHSNRPQYLPVFNVTIDPSHDTIITTLEGALICFPGQPNNPRLRLEVRHNNNIIGITWSKDEEKWPVHGYIAAPASFDNDIHLYTGAPGPNGDITWTMAHPLYHNSPPKDIVTGEKFFSDNCSTCHNLVLSVDCDLLVSATERHTLQWLREFTRDNAKLRASGDTYANAIYEQYNKTSMPVFPQLSDRDIDAIYHYIDYSTYKRRYPLPDSLLQQHAGQYYLFPFDSAGWYKFDTHF